MECSKCKVKCNKTGYGTILICQPAIFYKCPKCDEEYWEISQDIITISHWKRIKQMNRKRGKGNHVYE